MKTIRLTRGLALAATALTLATPMLAQAHDYQRYQDECTDRIHNNGVAGLLIGGIAGGAIGNSISHGGTPGTLLGAAAGAAVGSNIARSTTKGSCRGEDRVYYRAPAYHAVPAYPAYEGYPPPPAYEHHDRGLHRGWYKHGREDDGED